MTFDESMNIRIKNKGKKMIPKKQVAGLIVSPTWFNDPDLADGYIQTIADHGYALVDIFIRNTKTNLYSGREKLYNVLKQLTEKIHAKGMRCILDTDVEWWGADFVESCPEAAQLLIKGENITIRNGKFDFRTAMPAVKRQVVFDTVIAVFIQDENGNYRKLSDDTVVYEWQNIYQPRNGYQIKGLINDSYSGPAVFYISSRCFQLVDQAHPAYFEAQKHLIEAYRTIPFDGFGWDEPGKGNTSLAFFKSGEGFMKFFADRNGYALTDKLIYLDHCDDTEEAVKVRIDYFQSISAMNFNAQKQHNDYAEKVYARKLYFGTHHTWTGLPADLAGGVIDYFRLGQLLSASWTDGSWEVDLRYYVFHLMLADGLRNELGFEDAYYNDWGMTVPAIEDMCFATRFKMLFRINWFNIFFSDFSESLLNWRLKPLADIAKENVAQLDNFSSLTENFVSGTEVAILYTWEGMAAAPKWLSRLNYASIGNTAMALADSGLYASVMSANSIMNGKIADNKFICGCQEFKVIIVPYAYAIEETVFNKLLELSQHINVIFYGPLPSFTLSGKFVGNIFSAQAGIKYFSMKEYTQAYAEQMPLPGMDEWEPEHSDFIYPVTLTDGIPVYNQEGDIIMVKSKNSALFSVMGADPYIDLIEIIRSMVTLEEKVYADHAYYRIFKAKDGTDRQVILAVAQGRIADESMTPSRVIGDLGGLPRRKKLIMKTLFRLKNGDLEISDGTWGAVRFENGEITACAGDAKVISWNGNILKCLNRTFRKS
jgi:hypothetical protein